MDVTPKERDLAPVPFVLKIKIRFADVDSSRAVFFPRYLEWIDIAIGEYLDAAGLSFTPNGRVRIGDEELAQNLVFGEVHLRIHSPSTFGDILAIHTTLKELRKKTVSFECQILDDKDGRHLATGGAKIIWIDTQRFKSVEIPRPVTDRLVESQRGLPPYPEVLL